MYEMVIGLEVHVQMNTNSKIFCGCTTTFTDVANSHTCPVCQGHPGALPILNQGVVQKALYAAMATNSKINPRSLFDRKGYFYPDLPKGFQITQFYAPYCEKGFLEIEKLDGSKKKIGIDHIHIEEDAGKLVHSETGGSSSFVDLNRAGVPLLEIVSEPDIRTVEEAVLYATKLRQLMMYAGVTDGNMQEGSLRFDVNLSIMPQGSATFGTRTETKNLNSFTGLRKSIEMEFERQLDLIESGKQVEMETRLFNIDKMESKTLRKKGEGEEGYLYFREPDIPALVLSESDMKEAKESFPKMPEFYATQFLKAGIKKDDIVILTQEKDYAIFFEEALNSGNSSKFAQKMANFFLSDVLAYAKEKKREMKDYSFKPKELISIFEMIESGTISIKIAKELIPDMMETGKGIQSLVEEKGLTQMSNQGELEDIVKKLMIANPQNVEQYRNGKTNLLGFFVGQVMKETSGKANPSLVNDIVKKLLG